MKFGLKNWVRLLFVELTVKFRICVFHFIKDKHEIQMR